MRCACPPSARSALPRLLCVPSCPSCCGRSTLASGQVCLASITSHYLTSVERTAHPFDDISLGNHLAEEMGPRRQLFAIRASSAKCSAEMCWCCMSVASSASSMIRHWLMYSQILIANAPPPDASMLGIRHHSRFAPKGVYAGCASMSAMQWQHNAT